MQEFMNKIYAAFISTVLISLIILGPAFWIVTPFAFPLFLIFSTGFSYLIEKLYNFLNIKKWSYFIHLVLYSAAGFLAILIFCSTSSEGIHSAPLMALFGVPASILYFHILMMIRKLRSELSKKKKT